MGHSDVSFRIKRGATFLINFDVALDGQPLDLTGWTITSQVRNRGQLVATLLATSPELGKLEVSGPSDDWPISVLQFDVRFVSDSGQTTYTESVVFEVEMPETQP